MDHIDIMARTIYGEAGAQSEKSAVAVANVIMNRVRLPNWPNDIAGVCLQPWQFSCWNTTAKNTNRARIIAADGRDKWFRRCREIAAEVAKEPGGPRFDPTKRATHYHTHDVKPMPEWGLKRASCYNDGFHYFYNDVDTDPPADSYEALEQHRPIGKTRTVRSGKLAVAGVAGSGVLMELQSQLEPLIPYSEYLKYVFLGVALISIGVMVYARVQDRREGLR
ncbi:cell wall hydrolase [Sneathiella sp.]|uniref:cell wall hydrolase n=1 Tax=Sneathiella sp. TaxID=1964365 RepID=UPI002FE40BF7